jgi:glutathione synthase/RimK-type ligase-like ATP-grasp enzyme
MLPANEFDGATRSAVADQPRSEAWEFAQAVAESIASPAEVYVLDVCECDRELRLLELNPFGGADLYACNATEIVRAITEIL